MKNAVVLKIADWDALPDLITAHELADYWRTSTGYVYEQARNGALRPTVTRLGRSIRIRKDKLGELIAGGGIKVDSNRSEATRDAVRPQVGRVKAGG
jgi:excisionase family DNA binding protein